MRLTFVLAAFAAALSGTALAQTAAAPLTLKVDADEGTYIADGNGMALYLFEADTRGRNGMEPRIACTADCLGIWPPLIVDAMPIGADGIDAALLGTIILDGGLLQATYNGWPLYYYAGDAQPGDIRGHDINDFGEDWHLIGPHGWRSDDRNDRDNGEDDDGDDDGRR